MSDNQDLAPKEPQQVEPNPVPPESSPQTEGSVTKAMISLQSKIHTSPGPLPHPEILKQYENVYPGAAEKMFAMATEEGKHRMELEKQVVSGDLSRSFWGLCFGFSAVVIFGVCGTIAIMNGHDTAGATLATGATLGIATLFVTLQSGKSQPKESYPQLSEDKPNER